jgi:hypothetical protein
MNAFNQISAAELSSASYNWDFLSTAELDNSAMETSHLFFGTSSSLSVPDPTSSSQQVDSTSISPIEDGFFALPRTNDLASGHNVASYASSVQSDDLWTGEGTSSDPSELPSITSPTDPKATDRTCRRREQNRKAQSNFRQKRKEEVRRLEREVHELRAQLTELNKRGPVANLSICTTCRTFYPATAGDALSPSMTSDLFG